MKCKIKKVKSFKPNEKWFLPPDDIQTIKSTLEAAVNNAQYSVDPIAYYQDMAAKLDKIKELESIDNVCICGIKFSGNICYIPSKKQLEVK